MIKTELTFRVNRYYIISMDQALCNYVIFYSATALNWFGLNRGLSGSNLRTIKI